MLLIYQFLKYFVNDNFSGVHIRLRLFDSGHQHREGPLPHRRDLRRRNRLGLQDDGKRRQRVEADPQSRQTSIAASAAAWRSQVCLSVRLSVCPSVCLSSYLFVCLCMFVCLSVFVCIDAQ